MSEIEGGLICRSAACLKAAPEPCLPERRPGPSGCPDIFKGENFQIVTQARLPVIWPQAAAYSAAAIWWAGADICSR